MKTQTEDAPSVLLVEDEPDLRDAVVNFLRLDGIKVVDVGSLGEALSSLEQQQFDVILLDLGLPDGDGLELLQQRKDFKETGLIITSARISKEHRLKGIRCGADAYFVKPFDLEELSLQVRNLTRRVRRQQSGYWRLDEVHWSLVTPMGLAVKLTQSEIRFLKPLMGAAGVPVDRQVLVTSLGHKPDYYDARRMEIMVRRLRKKIDQIGSEALPLQTVYGFGFAFTGSATVQSEPN
jgi:two-component system response regulator PhoP